MYLGATVPILVIAFFVNNIRAKPFTIPQKTFLQLLMDDDANMRNAAMLAVALSDYLDLADQNVSDAHLRPICEGVRASKRLRYLKYASDAHVFLVTHACTYTEGMCTRVAQDAHGRPASIATRARGLPPALPTTGSQRAVQS